MNPLVDHWTPYVEMPDTHRFYGKKCNSLNSANSYTGCKNPARYISTLGHLATLRCEACQKRSNP
jgi:hypothetical protein